MRHLPVTLFLTNKKLLGLLRVELIKVKRTTLKNVYKSFQYFVDSVLTDQHHLQFCRQTFFLRNDCTFSIGRLKSLINKVIPRWTGYFFPLPKDTCYHTPFTHVENTCVLIIKNFTLTNSFLTRHCKKLLLSYILKELCHYCTKKWGKTVELLKQLKNKVVNKRCITNLFLQNMTGTFKTALSNPLTRVATLKKIAWACTIVYFTILLVVIFITLS